jgi:hypothetical protein
MFTTFPKETTIVYLDQNKWIDLSRAYHGMPEGKEFQPALTKIQSAVLNKSAIFPLSFQHYFETNKDPDLERRRRLARVMAELSQGICISPQERMMQWELERALAQLFNEQSPEIPPTFGYGIPCAFGFSLIVKDQSGNYVALPKEQSEQIRDGITSFDATFNLLMEDDNVEFHDWAQEFQITHNNLAGKLEEFRKTVRKLGKLSRKRAYIVHLATALEEEITKVLGYFDKTPEDLFSIGAEKLDAFWENIPTLDVEIELNVSRNEHWDRKIESNDATDIAFLNVAIPYCDVLVLEKYFHNLARNSKLDKKYNTRIIKSLSDLENFL